LNTSPHIPPRRQPDVDQTGGLNTLNSSLPTRAIPGFNQNGLDLNLNAGQVQPVDQNGDTLAITGRFAAIVGSNFGDKIIAASHTTLLGGDGNDTLIGGGTDISLFGGTGDDSLTAEQ